MKDYLIYQKGTGTIRLMPYNYWIATVNNKRLVFDSWDGCTIDKLKDINFQIETVNFYFRLLKNKLL